MTKIPATISHSGIKLHRACDTGLRRFEQHLPVEMFDTFERVSLLGCLKVCTAADVFWAMHTSPHIVSLAEVAHLMLADIFQTIADDTNHKLFIRTYFGQLADYWRAENFRAASCLKPDFELGSDFFFFDSNYTSHDQKHYSYANFFETGKLHLLKDIATCLSADYGYASEFDEKLRKIIRKYLCHGDGYKFPIGLELIKPMRVQNED